MKVALNFFSCSKAIRLYLQNLCYNPSGFDSWAGLALARSRKIMEKLNMASFGGIEASPFGMLFF